MLLNSPLNELFNPIRWRLDEAAHGVAINRQDGVAAGIATIGSKTGKALMDRTPGRDRAT